MLHSSFCFCLVLIHFCLVSVTSLVPFSRLHTGVRITSTNCFPILPALQMGARNRAWAKGELSDKDIFDDEPLKSKRKFKPSPEEVVYEGPPSKAELLVPTLSIITVIGIIPFLAALARQFWVNYKITSRRIAIKSGVGGGSGSTSEVVYSNIKEMRFAYRAFGLAGDLVLFLKDGAQVEMRFVPDFPRLYTYIFDQCDESCRTKSMKIVRKSNTDT